MFWKRLLVQVFLIAPLAPLVVTDVLASQTPKIRIEIKAEREITLVAPSGEIEVKREPARQAAGGDVLVYTLQIVNEGSAPALKTKVVDPVPSGTILIPDSVGGEGTRAAFSIDGGATYASYPITREVVREDGSTEELPVPIEEYTHVRWTLTEPLAPRQTRAAYFKVRVQ